MVDSSSYLDALAQLTPRQDRIEGALVQALVSRATRSELRELVHQYADLLRLQGSSPERTIASLRALVRRTAPRMPFREDSVACDSPEDRLNLIVHWCSARLNGAEVAEPRQREKGEMR